MVVYEGQTGQSTSKIQNTIKELESDHRRPTRNISDNITIRLARQ